MAKPKSALDILVKELKEIHSAERQMSRLVPKLLKRIDSESLRKRLETRRDQGAMIIEGLDEIFEEMEVTKARPKNVAAEGLIEDVNQHLEEIDDPRLLDPVLLASIQKIEHYCVAAWGTAASLGRLLNENKVVQLMERALRDGKQYDEELTQLAEKEINPRMLEEAEAA
ncbi:MAG TPA: DUF892 family protein [Allosphingosinicella sp.]|jgi:ferritin-like metal-binding protein YciE